LQNKLIMTYHNFGKLRIQVYCFKFLSANFLLSPYEICMHHGRRQREPWPPLIFIHGTDNVEGGLMVLFFGLFFHCSPSWKFFADALDMHPPKFYPKIAAPTCTYVCALAVNSGKFRNGKTRFMN